MKTNIVPLVEMGEFNTQLDLAILGNETAIKFIDRYTINRIDGMGFDMFSKTLFWSNNFKKSDSICACVTGVYTKYRNFRKNQK